MATKITRTISHTHATVKCINTKTLELSEKTVELPFIAKDEEGVLVAARRELATEPNIMVVSVINYNVVSAKYEMTLTTFINNAKCIG